MNECLHSGPSLSRSLYEVLLRFRGHNFAVCADIEKSFLQIGLHPDDRDLVRFLWFKDGANIDPKHFENNELTELRLCRVLFGATSSSFLLNATLLHHCKKFTEEDKEFVYQLIESLHVDDLHSVADTEQEAYNLYVKAKSLLSEGGFNLRKFQSNSIYLENLIRSTIHTSDIDMPRITKILGLVWDKDKDVINFDMKAIAKKAVEPETKRHVLQLLASIYDPLGLINPIVVRIKIFLHDVCIAKYKWDENLRDDLLVRWREILNDLQSCDSLSVPRNYCFNDLNNPFVNIQLHGFSDASKMAYAGCIYLRFTRASGSVQTAFLTSISRVIPIKSFAIPRLELLGALLLARLINTVAKAISYVYKIDETFLWTDSSIVFFLDPEHIKRIQNIRS